jgi:DNA-binding GntR family transcriptional regulator
MARRAAERNESATNLSFALPEDEWRRMLPYLPFGLSAPASAGPIARAQGALKHMLLVARLHPGQKVPMDDIADQLAISRTPVREALRLLEGEGLVRALPNRGFAVRVTSIEETAQLFDARSCLETFTAARAFELRDERFVRDLRAIQKTYRRILTGTMNRRFGMVVDKAFHTRISQQAGNPVLVDVQQKLFDVIIFTRALEGSSPERSKAAVAEHEDIIAALQGSKSQPFRDAVLANITNGRDAIIAFLRAMGFQPPG